MHTLLTLDEIRALPGDVPDGERSGIYFLWWDDELQYIGYSSDMPNRYYIHHTAWRYRSHGYSVKVKNNRCTMLHAPMEGIRALEKAYIREYCPPFNKQSNPRCS